MLFKQNVFKEKYYNVNFEISTKSYFCIYKQRAFIFLIYYLLEICFTIT